MSIYLMRNGQKHGPFEDSVVQGWLLSGNCSPDDLAWRNGMKEWQPLRTIRFYERKSGSGLGGLITLFGLASAGVSFALFIWGYWYVSSNRFEGFTSAVGMSDGTYQLAQGAMVLGVLGMLFGIGVLIAGLAGSVAGRK